MTQRGFALFPSPIGSCAIAWSDRGVVGVQLPFGGETKTRDKMRLRFPDAVESDPSGDARHAIAAIIAMMLGERSQIDAIELVMDGIPEFHRRVYQAARAVPRGSTTSYGALAAQLGRPGAARAVGQAMKNNPFTIIVPCHRVLAAGGRTGGFTAHGGIATKERLLSLERIRLSATTEKGLLYSAVEASEHLCASDRRMAALVEAVGPLTLQARPVGSIFRALAESVVYQQLTGKAAATIFGRLESLLEGRLEPETVLASAPELLLSAGLSRAKEASIRDLAQHVVRGAIPTLEQARRLDDEELIERLTVVRGVGRWTVEMLLIFRLGRPDVLPRADLGVRKGFGKLMGSTELPAIVDLERRAAKWMPFRSAASWYLWRALELPE